jgi:hypothetical protein
VTNQQQPVPETACDEPSSSPSRRPSCDEPSGSPLRRAPAHRPAPGRPPGAGSRRTSRWRPIARGRRPRMAGRPAGARRVGMMLRGGRENALEGPSVGSGGSGSLQSRDRIAGAGLAPTARSRELRLPASLPPCLPAGSLCSREVSCCCCRSDIRPTARDDPMTRARFASTRPEIERLPCTLPADQGIAARGGLVPACIHRHSAFPWRDDFAGPMPIGRSRRRGETRHLR